MTIGDDTHAWRRCVSESARDIILAGCIHGHASQYWLDCAVVMPDHVHMLLAPYPPETLATVLNGVKGASAHRINALLGRRGKLWQRESFDHILRSSEKVTEKAEYICNNPVRAGLVASADDWPWLFRSWSAPEGGRAHT